MIRQSALAYTKKGKYCLVYHKILAAAALDAVSDRIAEGRRLVASMYRNRLDTYLYCLLVPQVPLYIVTRQLVAVQQEVQAGRFSRGDVLLRLLLLHYAVTLAIAVWLRLVRQGIK